MEIAPAKKDHKKKRFYTDIQMIFHDPIASLDPCMTVEQIIAEGLVINGEKDKKVIQNKVSPMFLCGITTTVWNSLL